MTIFPLFVFFQMAPKKKRQRKNKKWIPWKELTQEEREQLRRESDKKSFRKLLKETKDRTKAAEASGNYLDMLHAPRPTNEVNLCASWDDT